MRRSLACVVAWATLGGGLALAQGTQNGIMSGTVRSVDKQTLPGVNVTVKSPALIGTRSTVTDANGAYILKGLPTGEYVVTFEMSGFGSLQKKTAIALGGTATVDATLDVAKMEENVVVTAEAPSILATTEGGQQLKATEIDTLAVTRDLVGTAELVPGLTNNTPNAQQLTINGGFAYDNVFLIDGVDIDDNVFGTPNDLFIEDAIQDTQVITSGISAEYGRFSGGVVNAITKRGGNDFSGSFRVDFTNPKWTTQTPFEKENKTERKSTLNKIYQETFGGPILKDRLWFFLAARQSKVTDQKNFDFTGLPHTDVNDNKRFEGRLTGAIVPNHTLQFGYTRNNSTLDEPSFDFSIDPATYDHIVQPNHLFVGSYNGVLKPNLFVEAQFSQQNLEFTSGGGTSSDLVESPFLTFTQTDANGNPLHYNSPYFGFSVDPEQRKNRQLTASLSYFLSTQGFGKHDLKAGFENFRSGLVGGNTQSSTNYVLYADYKADAQGDPVFDSNNRLIPVFEPGGGLFANWISSRGATLDITTNSYYVNDRWAVGGHLSLNLGVRYEKVRSEATGGIVGVDTDTIVPRLGAIFDVKGDGRFTLQGSYAHYAGKYNEAQIGNNTKVGNPSLVYGLYVGPPGEGRGFAPGFDISNYLFLGGNIPDANVIFDNGLSSPVTREYTVGGGVDLGRGGFVKLLYTHRKVTGFIEDFTTIDQGTVDVTVPTPCLGCEGTIPLDKRVFKNSDLPQRNYSGLQIQAGYRPVTRLNLQANWTHQFTNDGDFTGENTNQPAVTSPIGDYPELLPADRYYPMGRLPGYERDKVRMWATYDQGLGRFGNLDLGVLYRYDSPLTFDFASPNQSPSGVQLALDPGYANFAGTQYTLYFGSRGSGSFNASHLFDLALTYNIKAWKKARPYFKVDLRNAFNSQPLIAFNTTVRPDVFGPVDSFGQPLNYVKDQNFGKATSNTSFPVARTYRFAVGFRF
jgi:hypothetical protein